jgi:hypothetical protein
VVVAAVSTTAVATMAAVADNDNDGSSSTTSFPRYIEHLLSICRFHVVDFMLIISVSECLYITTRIIINNDDDDYE